MDITIMNNVCLKPREVDCPVCKGLRNMWGMLGSKKQEPAEEPLGDLRIDNGVFSRKTKGWD